MGVVDTLASSIIQVLAGLFGFGFLISGSQQAAYGSEAVGMLMFFIGVVLIVFAAKL